MDPSPCADAAPLVAHVSLFLVFQSLALVFVGAALAVVVAASDPQLRGIVHGDGQGKGTTFIDRLRRHRPSLPSLRDYEVGMESRLPSTY